MLKIEYVSGTYEATVTVNEAGRVSVEVDPELHASSKHAAILARMIQAALTITKEDS